MSRVVLALSLGLLRRENTARLPTPRDVRLGGFGGIALAAGVR